MLGDPTSAVARRAFYAKLVEFVESEGGVFSPAHASLIQWIAQELESGCGATIDLLFGAVAFVIAQGWKTLGVIRLLHYLRAEFRIPPSLYAEYLVRQSAPYLVGSHSDCVDLPFVSRSIRSLLTRQGFHITTTNT